MNTGPDESRMTPEQKDERDQELNTVAAAQARIARLEITLARLNRDYVTLREALVKEQRDHINTSFGLTEELNNAKAELANMELIACSWGQKSALLEEAITACLPKLTHGEFLVARDRLRQVVARLGENRPALWPIEGTTEVIPVAGRGLKAGVVGITTDSRGMVIRIDDDQRPEFWIELVVSRARLLRVLAMMERRRPCECDQDSAAPDESQILDNENG